MKNNNASVTMLLYLWEPVSFHRKLKSSLNIKTKKILLNLLYINIYQPFSISTPFILLKSCFFRLFEAQMQQNW